MRKVYLLICIILSAAFMSACGSSKVNKGNMEVSPTQIPTVTLPAENSGTNVTQAPSDNGENVSLEDYYPIQPDTEYVYEGTGNEYATYQMFIDFIDHSVNRIQTRANNGGSETVRVIEVKNDKISIVRQVIECYYRDNLINKAAEAGKYEILLMKPLVKGTEWLLPDGRKRYISGTDVKVATPSGTYQAVEVTTENEDGKSMDYYVKGVGLVKTIYRSGDTEVTSSLSEIKKNTPFTQTINVYYPDSDEKLNTETLNLTFHTGDITRQILQKAIKEQMPGKNYAPLLSSNTIINSMYLGDDGIAYVDFSPEFVTEMNAGSGFEMQILQGITNTLGNYYGVNEVCITVAGKPYESGAILMKKGETLKVNYAQ